jgi:hypothetical protein
MAVFEIEFPTDPVAPQFIRGVILDEIAYNLRFNYNGREDAWYMSVRTTENTSIAEGIKMVLEFPLLRKISSSNRPPGELMLVEDGDFTDNAGQLPGLTDIGRRVSLLYFDAEEVADAVG